MEKFFIAFLILISLNSGCILTGQNQEKVKGKNFTDMNKNVYPVIFADNRRSSYINTTSKCKGDNEWETLTADVGEPPFEPRGLLLAGNQVFIYSDDLIKAFNSNGEKQWERKIRAGSPVSIKNNKIYFRSTDYYDKLSAVGFDNIETDQSMWILEADGGCFPLYIEPLEDSFIALCQCKSPPEQGSSMFLFYKKKYETENFTWVDNISGKSMAAPLHILEKEYFVVFSKDEVVIYNSSASGNGNNIINRFQLPFEKILSASADPEGNLYLFGEIEQKMILICVNQKGEELWRWSGGTVSNLVDYRHPPVIGTDRNIYIITGNRIVTINNGREIYDFISETSQIVFCTAVADGDIFLSAGNVLYQVGNAGSVKMKKIFKDKIMAPPVIDSDGNVYIVTSTKLTKLK